MKPRDVLLVALPTAALVGGLASCDNDRGARQDLPNSQQDITEGTADVILMPDKFASLVHRCIGPRETTGYYTNTDRYTWIVINDPDCGGEGPILVLDNIPGGDLSADGGES